MWATSSNLKGGVERTLFYRIAIFNNACLLRCAPSNMGCEKWFYKYIFRQVDVTSNLGKATILFQYIAFFIIDYQICQY